MRPRDRDRRTDLRERAGADQARRDPRRLLALALGALLAGCAVPKEINPVEIYREVSGINDAKRLPPPGLDQPFPNLASVPPRPERPPAEARDAISAALSADRSASREPLVLRGAAPPAAEAAPGSPPLPARPPAPPALAAVPIVPWQDTVRQPAPAAVRPPAAPAPRSPESTPDLRPGPAPAAAPAPAMPEAPPAPPPAEFLAPGAGPPPPPSSDLLAPTR